MSAVEVRAALASARDLTGLTEEALDALVAMAGQPRSFQPGQEITPDDEESKGLYVVAEGMVSVTNRSEQRRAGVEVVQGPGDVFGEDSLARVGIQGARAIGPSTIVFLDADAIREAARSHPSIAAMVERLDFVQRRGPWTIDQLRRSPLFRYVPLLQLYPLLEGARLEHWTGPEEGHRHSHYQRTYREGFRWEQAAEALQAPAAQEDEPGEVILRGDEVLDGFYVVVEGSVRLEAAPHPTTGQAAPRPVVLGAGAVIGDVGLVHREPLHLHVSAGAQGCTLLVVTLEAFQRQLRQSTAFRRGVLASPVLGPGERAALVEAQITNAIDGTDLMRSNWTAVTGDRDDLPISTLARWLAEAAALEWGDRTGILRFDRSHSGPPRAEDHPVLGPQVSVYRFHPSDRPYDVELMARIFDSDNLLLDFQDVPRDSADYRYWLSFATRTVYVAADAYAGIPEDILRTIRGPLVYTAVVPSRVPEPGEVRKVPRGTLRLHRDLVQAAREDRDLASLHRGQQAQVGRWMRGVTERRIGVALGGGGALSMAELAMLQRLHERQVPIDLVAGVSGGAMVGAFYAADRHCHAVGQPFPAPGQVPDGLDELPGLASLVQLGGRFASATVPGGMVTSAVVADFLERHLDVPAMETRRLEDLLLPFIPVACDIDTATQVSIRTGPIGFGVRCSGSFPGTFTATTVDRQETLRPGRWRFPRTGRSGRPNLERGERRHVRLVDGGIINNIPDDTLLVEGAQVVLACDVVPAPRPREETSHPAVLQWQKAFQALPTPVGRALREVEPVTRADDVQRALFLMLHQPADWQARPVDARFHADTKGFSFTNWAGGDALRRKTLSPELLHLADQAIDELERAMHGLRWHRDPDMGGLRIARLMEAAVAVDRAKDSA